PRLEPDRARPRGGRPRHRAAAPAVPRRAVRPSPDRPAADRARRGARGGRLRRMGTQPARTAPRRVAASLDHAVDPRRDRDRDSGHRRHRPARLGYAMTGPTGPEPTGPEPAGPDPAGQGQPRPSDDPEERDPGLARERTSLSWMRT